MPLVDGRIVISVSCPKCGESTQLSSGNNGFYCSKCARPNSITNFRELLQTELQKVVLEERKRIREDKKQHKFVSDDYSVGGSVVISSCSLCKATFTEGKVFVVDGEPICERCRSNLPSCNGCGEKHLKKYLKDGVCAGCAVSFKKCTTCGKTYDRRHFREFDVEEPGEGVKHFCDNCVDTYLGVKNIRYEGYSHKPRPTFFGDMETGFPMGVELEMDNSRRRKEFMARAHCDEIYFKSDGSLVSGVELVTHPCTLDYHMKELPWRHILDTAKACGYRSHTGTSGDSTSNHPTCGLHVHVSRDAFGRSSDERDKREAKLLLLFDKFWDKLVIFSRRDSRSLERWAKRYATFDVSKEQIDTLIKKAKDVSGRDRRMAVNICNGEGGRDRSTVEFRMFRGTLNYETLIATLQLLVLLVECTTLTTKKVQLMTWEDFRDMGCERFTEFSGYIKRLQSNKKKI